MTVTTAEHIASELRSARSAHPELAGALDLYADLVEAGAQAAAEVRWPEARAEEIGARLAAGFPLLGQSDLAPNWEPLARRYEQVCAIAARHRPDLADAFDGLRGWAQSDLEGFRASVTSYLEKGHPGASGEPPDVPETLRAFVFGHTLRACLRGYAEGVAPLLPEELWQRGSCPVCGGEPDLGDLDAKTGARHLVCSRCDTRWLYPRVKCPFCGTDRPADLSYYPTDDERYRVYTCGVCRRYLKTRDLRQAGPGDVPADVIRVLTVDLDAAAQDEGYR